MKCGHPSPLTLLDEHTLIQSCYFFLHCTQRNIRYEGGEKSVDLMMKHKPHLLSAVMKMLPFSYSVNSLAGRSSIETGEAEGEGNETVMGEILELEI